MTDLNVSLNNVQDVTSQMLLSAVPSRRLNLPTPSHACLIKMYRSSTKLGEGNVFTEVCHSIHKGVSLVSCPFQEGVISDTRSLLGVGMSGGGVDIP